MRFHYGGKHSDDSQLVRKPDPDGSVMFKEPDDLKKMAVRMNIISLVILVVLLAAINITNEDFKVSFPGMFLFILSMVPHEFLHGLCFKEDVTMYTNLSKFMLFVYGTEDFSKTRFILMSLCPNIIFGMIPLILYFLFPQYASLGTLGALAFSAGAGDYVNVFHALTEVPNGAKVYCNGIHTYWYKTE